MNEHLPLEVLGLVSPILSWVEGTDGLRLPTGWRSRELPLARREKGWLARELPTYSYDTFDEILRLARCEGAGSPPHRPWSSPGSTGAMEPPHGWELPDVFHRLAERYLRWDGTGVAIRRRRLEELHELSLRLPVNHLVRHVHVREVAEGSLSEQQALGLTEQVSALEITSRGLRSVVGRGLSEGHIHLWGVTSAEVTWADQLLHHQSADALGELGPRGRRLLLLSRYALKALALGILQAELGVARHRPLAPLLARLDGLYLARGRVAVRHAEKRLRRSLERALAIDWPVTNSRRLRGLRWLLRLVDPVLVHLRTHASVAGWEMVEREGIRDRVRLVERLQVHAQLHLLRLRRHSWTRRATSRNQDEIGSQRFLGDYLHRCFYRYLIYQAHHWQLATQSGRTTGLRYFKRFYDARQREATVEKGDDVTGWILERLRASPHLHTVEGRLTVPKGDHGDLIPWVLGYGEGARQGELDRFGLVVHFIKDEWESESEAGAGQSHRFAVRKGRSRRKARDTALRLHRLLSRAHPVTPFIVGIDAANVELTTPPEVFAPAFRFLREYPIEVQRSPMALQRFRADPEIRALMQGRRLGLTYHVGEEFRHLLSGLRAISETIAFLKPMPGDRLGHAIALGIDPLTWARQMGFQAVMPKLDALDSLVWVHWVLGSGDEMVDQLGVEEHIQSLSHEIYGPAAREAAKRGERTAGEWSPLTLRDAWFLRQLDPGWMDLDALMRGEGRLIEEQPVGPEQRRWWRVQRKVLERVHGRVGSSDAYRLLAWYWYDPGVRSRGAEIFKVDLGEEGSLRQRQWMELLTRAQEKLQGVVQRRQLVVEVNPSSNRLVGPIAGYKDHPIFRLTLDKERRDLERTIRVTINTDDPGVFNTSLAHEYYLLGEIRLAEGVPEGDVTAWLEWLRTNGNEFTFLEGLPDASDRRVRKILDNLKASCRSQLQRLGGRRSMDHFWGWIQRGLPTQERWANLHRRVIQQPDETPKERLP